MKKILDLLNDSREYRQVFVVNIVRVPLLPGRSGEIIGDDSGDSVEPY